MTVNGVGALATGVTLVIVLIAKFVEGAWITVILIPLLLAIFVAVRRHYHAVAGRSPIRCPLNVRNIQPPIVIIPMREWNKMSQKGLRFALKLSPDIYVVQIRTGEAAEGDLIGDGTTTSRVPTAEPGCRCLIWSRWPRRTGTCSTRCSTTCLSMKREHPDRQIAV